MRLEKSVKDLMHPLSHYISINENERVKRALDLIEQVMDEGIPPCLIVTGNDKSEKEEIQGFITPPEIVFGIAEQFLSGADRIGPIFWDGQLKNECLSSFRKPVKEIMAPIKTSINGTEKLMEAIFLFNKYRVRYLPVVRSEEVTGIIHLEDIFREIAEMTVNAGEV